MNECVCSLCCQLSWNESFAKLEQFKEENGHVKVPKGYKNDPHLGNWGTRVLLPCRCAVKACCSESFRQTCHGEHLSLPVGLLD